MNQKALILVDFENEWTNPDSDYFVWDTSVLIEKTNILIDRCRKDWYKIIFTTHIEKDSDWAFKENSENVELIKELHKNPEDVLIKKYKISPFYKTELEKELEWIEEIVICWILTNLCVRSLAEGAYDRDFGITIVSDCCKTFDKETHDFTLKDIKATREEIEITDLDWFLW